MVLLWKEKYKQASSYLHVSEYRAQLPLTIYEGKADSKAIIDYVFGGSIHSVLHMSQHFTLQFVMSALHEAGWQAVQTDEYWLLIPTRGKHGKFFISFYINHHNRMLAARGNIPVYIPKEKELIALKFINYSNYRIPIGNLELDVESEQTFFRVGMFFEKIDLNAQLLHNVVHEIYQAVQDFQPAIQAIMQDEVSIEDAFRLTNST